MKTAIENRICDNLIELTQAIEAIDAERVAHGFLGGEHGYGAHWDNATFEMRPYYWGDCDCGFPEREEAWSAINKHKSDCYQSALKQRMAEYDKASGYVEVEQAAFGSDSDPLDITRGMDVQEDSPVPGVVCMVMEPRLDAAMERWRDAHDARQKHEDALYKELCAHFGLKYPNGCAIHCTCGLDRAYQEWAKENHHRATCSVMLPNFRHKASGFEVRWYKYIGRSMEYEATPPKSQIDVIFAECVASLRPLAH